MGSASLALLAYAAAVVLVLNLRAQSVDWRQWVLLLGSLGFLCFFSLGLMAWLPLLGFLGFGYWGTRHGRGIAKDHGGLWVIVLCVALFVWLKRYSFVPASLLLPAGYLTLGLSYIFFRVLHLIIDSQAGELEGETVSPLSYLNYTVNFTTLLSGPIQNYPDFARDQLGAKPLPLDIFIVTKAFERIVVGFFKVNVLSLALGGARSAVFTRLMEGTATNGEAASVIWAALLIGLYPLELYCNFSGYIDIVIAVARLLRLELPENFDRPFASGNFLVFWSRWHITLSAWLRTYVYNPLLLATLRRTDNPSAEPFSAVGAFFITFFLVGLWHGQTPGFLFFGLLQGVGASAVKLYQILMTKQLGRKRYRTLANHALYTACARGLTYTWFAFTLLWFWSTGPQLEKLAKATGAEATLLALLLLLTIATASLAGWEWLREQLLSWSWSGHVLLTSRYTRTVWTTTLAVIALAVTALLNAPAPDIVYKQF